jgi:ELWxxDGT repeat protein
LREWVAKRGSQKGCRKPSRPRLSLEELEPRQLLSSYHFDFGTPTSPVAQWYTKVPLTAYSAQQGYGWASLSGLRATTEATGHTPSTDFHSGTDDTFLVDLPNGSYDVMPSLGDARAAHTVNLWAQGQPLATGLTSAAGQYLHPTYRANVTTGQLQLRIQAAGGTGSTFALDALDVNPGSGTFEHMNWNQMTTRPNADISLPGVAGAEFHISWAMVEPSKGTFDWSEVDSLLSTWHAADKKITLIIKTSPDGAESNPYQGSATPSWVYAEGAQSILTNKLGVNQQLPVLWDPIFLAEYQHFVQQFAARYDGNPAIEYIIVGPGVFSSTRSFYQGQPNAFQPLGYTEALWYQTNQRIVGFYQNAFQLTHLALGMAPFDDSNSPDPQYNDFTLAQWAAAQGLYVYYHNLYGNSTWVNSAYPQFFASLGTTTKIALGMDNPTSTNATYYQTYGDPVSCANNAFGAGSTGLPGINTYYLEWYTDDVDAANPASNVYQQQYANALALAGQDFAQTDVTGQPAPADLNPTSYDGWDSFASPLVNVNGTVYFAGSDGSQGNVLWKNDGTAAGSVPVQNLNSPTLAWAPEGLTNVGGELFFAASDGVHGVELWKSDGTDAGTVMVADLNPGRGDSQPSFLTNVNGELFFSANDGTDGPQLWKSDGTADGTVMVSHIANPAANVFPYDLTAVGSKVFFAANDGVHGPQLWESDGTTAGTVMVKAVNAANGTGPANLTNVNGELFFTADDGVTGRQLWKSDGTAAGTALVQAINPGGDSEPEYLTNVNGTLFFSAYNGANDGLWKSDGTPAGTTLLAALTPGGTSLNPADLTVVGATVFFAAGDPTAGYNLWESNGTVAGTVPVLGQNPNGAASSPYGLANVHGVLYFAGSDSGTYGTELWRSDGTAAGSVLVADINPGSNSSFPENLTEADGTVYFWATAGAAGPQLWKWDANPAAQFAVAAPATSTAGNAFPVTVTVLDRYGHTGSIYTGTVHFTSSDGAATLPANYTFTGTDNGIHTFTGLNLYAAGTESVVATDTANGSVTGQGVAAVSPAGVRHLVVTGPATSTAGSALAVTVTAVDQFNNPVPTYTGTVTFTSPDSRATLPANYTFTAADRGVHTFAGVVLVKAGAGSVTAQDTVTCTIKGTAAVTVTPAAAVSLQVLLPTGGTTAGASFSVTVTALDQFGNVATGYTGAVQFTSSDPAAVLPARYTFTAADQGVHTFTVALKTAGLRAVTVTDTLTVSITGQNSLKVWPAAASQFSVTVSTSTPTAGSAVTVSVLALDPYGNTATAYTGTVHFTSPDVQAVLPADYTFTTADAGYHVFTQLLTFKTAGAQAVGATDTLNGGITGSASVTVQPGAATHFRVTPSTKSPKVGVAFTVTVTALDAYGNVATGFQGQAQFLSSDPLAILPSTYLFQASDMGKHTFQVTLQTAGAQTVTVQAAGDHDVNGSASLTAAAL